MKTMMMVVAVALLGLSGSAAGHSEAELLAELQGSTNGHNVRGLVETEMVPRPVFTARPATRGGLNVRWSVPPDVCGEGCWLAGLERNGRGWLGSGVNMGVPAEGGFRIPWVGSADAPVWMLLTGFAGRLVAHAHVEPGMVNADPDLPIPPFPPASPTGICANDNCSGRILPERAFVPWLPRAGAVSLRLTLYPGGLYRHDVWIRVKKTRTLRASLGDDRILWERGFSAVGTLDEGGPFTLRLDELHEPEDDYSVLVEATHPIAVVATLRNPAGFITILPVMMSE